MRLGGKLQVQVGITVLLGAFLCEQFALAGTAAGPRRSVAVIVNNSAGVSQAVLGQAEAETARIFRLAEVDITWLNCQGRSSVGDACLAAPAANQFVLHIVPNGKTRTEFVFGTAFLGPDGSGKYCDVFFDRVREAYRNFGVGLPRLLGAVSAHELGHLLLGSQAHSWIGVMTAVWNEDTLLQVETGSLVFTREQSAAMKARMTPEEPSWALVGAKIID